MDPNTKLLLDEISKRFSDEISKRFAENDLLWESRLAEFDKTNIERVDKLEKAAAEFKDWQPQIEAHIEDAKLEIRKLSRHWDRSVRERSSLEPGLVPNPCTTMLASERPPARDLNADGPDGHRDVVNHRDGGFGSVYIQTHHPVKGSYLGVFTLL